MLAAEILQGRATESSAEPGTNGRTVSRTIGATTIGHRAVIYASPTSVNVHKLFSLRRVINKADFVNFFSHKFASLTIGLMAILESLSTIRFTVTIPYRNNYFIVFDLLLLS